MKIKSYDEIAAGLLSPEYVLANGVWYYDLFDEFYWENGRYHYQQMFDWPRDEGGKPFTGIAYDLDDAGNLIGYTLYEDGWESGGADVSFYPSHRLRHYSECTDTAHYSIGWHENGVVSYLTIHNRKDRPDFYISKEYDENGNKLKQRIYCEFDYTHRFDAPDDSFEVTFHKNGEFRSIRKKNPTREDFYAQFEFDEAGYPVKCSVNPMYAPAYLSPEKFKKSFGIKVFDDSFHEESGVLMRQKFIYSGRLCFLHKDGWIEKIMEYHNGVLLGPQYLYYPNGNLKEEYCTEKRRLYSRHIRWYESGMIRDVVIFSKSCGAQYCVSFDEKGNVTRRHGRLYDK